MKYRIKAYILLLTVTANVTYAAPINWNLYNQEFYNYSQISRESTRGENSVLINSNPVPINENTLKYLKKFKERDRNGGVLFQTINASKYRGKHLHISVFAKYVTFDVETFTKNYQLYLEEVSKKNNIESARKNRNLYSELYRRKFEYFFNEKSIGIRVYAHQKNKVTIFEMTTPDNEIPIDWQRFNTEIDVPLKASYITIALWMKGSGSAYFDHVVIAEQGIKLNQTGRTYKYQYCENCKKNAFLLYLRNTISSKGTIFENTSFEKSNK